MNSVILNSGGMDTFLLAHELARAGEYPLHLFVDVGQVYRDKELRAATHVAASLGQPLNVVKGAQLNVFEHSTGIIPFRNAELILCAAQYADTIYMGVLADEINSDKSPEFMSAMEEVLNISHRRQYWTQGRTFHIRTPLRDRNKTQLVREYLCAGGFARPLLQTVSCYDSGDRHCGRCGSCFKRWVALTNNGMDVREHFERDPLLWRTAPQWREAAASYSPARAAEVTEALRRGGLHL